MRLADDAVLPRPGAGRPRATCASTRILEAAAERPAPRRSTPATASSPRTPASPARSRRPGIAFVGPTPGQLELFGIKHTARALAEAAGVPLLAGTGLLADADEAVAAAEPIGYPVMLKATGGGGGIGMRVCRRPTTLRGASTGCAGWPARSFGVGGVFLERYVERARHVEVQVFGDGAGRVVALGDRDCSLQRRNQKVVEEAPAPACRTTCAAACTTSARALAASVDYRSAGTVEFVYDAEREEASFLEVNTRLQVEHPVTEAVTGVDLVEWMLRLAGGERTARRPVDALGLGASGARRRGARLRRGPGHGLRPSAGPADRGRSCRRPGRPGRRLGRDRDGGLARYDPMLAKVIATGADRDERSTGCGEALDETRIDGIETNLGLLRARRRGCPRSGPSTHTTGTLDTVGDPEPRIDVSPAGPMTTVQDLPGPARAWQVGVPPSGADGRPLASAWATARSATTRTPPASSAPPPVRALRFTPRHARLRHRRRRRA